VSGVSRQKADDGLQIFDVGRRNSKWGMRKVEWGTWNVEVGMGNDVKRSWEGGRLKPEGSKLKRLEAGRIEGKKRGR
jgi:hypothetical protein